MKIDDILIILKIALNALLIVLAFLFIDTFQCLMGINCHAEYTFEIPVCTQMSNLGTVCLTSVLLLIASWGLVASILPKFGENTKINVKKLRIIIFLVILVLLIGMAIVGNYFAQRIDRWSF